MGRWLIFALCLTAAMSIAVGSAPAVAAELEIMTSTAVMDDGVQLIATIRNIGDAPVHNIIVTTRFLGQEHVFPTRDRLDPGRLFTVRLPMHVQPETPGAYAWSVRAVFIDEKGLPDWKLGFGKLSWQSPALPLVHAEVHPAGSGKFELVLTVDPETPPGRVRIKPIAPSCVAVRPAFVEIDRPQTGQTVAFDVICQKPVCPAELDVLALLEYQVDGLHYASVIDGRAGPVRPSIWPRRAAPIWSVLSLLCLAALVWTRFRAGRGGERR